MRNKTDLRLGKKERNQLTFVRYRGVFERLICPGGGGDGYHWS